MKHQHNNHKMTE
jgi:hypothetical protein